MAANPDRLFHAVRARRAFLRDNTDWHEDLGGPPDDDDALEDLMNDCGRVPGGGCMLAGSEQCDWECPFSG